MEISWKIEGNQGQIVAFGAICSASRCNWSYSGFIRALEFPKGEEKGPYKAKGGHKGTLIGVYGKASGGQS